MNKFIASSLGLLMAAALTAPVHAQSGEDFSSDFTYAKKFYTAYSLNYLNPQVTTVYMAFKFRTEDLSKYAGCRITSINVTAPTDGLSNPSNNVPEVNVFITKNLTKPSEYYQQKGELTTQAYGMNRIALDTPYEIGDGSEPIYVGYSFLTPDRRPYFMVVDGEQAESTNLIYGTSENNSLPPTWNESGAEYGFGSLYLSCTIKGDNLPHDIVEIRSGSFPSYVPTGESGSYTLTLFNPGSNDVYNLEVETTVDGAEPFTTSIPLMTTLVANTEGNITVDNVKFPKAGFNKVKSRIVKINQNEPAEIPEYTGNVAVYDDGFDRNLVIEEGTGTWCGWCPSGTVMLDYIRETYPDRFFCVAVHSGNDRMKAPSYESFVAKYWTSFPAALINRIERHNPGTIRGPQINEEAADRFYKQFTSYPAYCRIDFNGNIEEDGNTKVFTVSADAEFGLDTDVPHYMSFIVTEDNVGPYEQSNYFSGGGNGEMGGWEKRGDHDMVYFNEVARVLHSFPGIAGSLPAKIEAGKKYNWTGKVNILPVSGQKFAVIAIITNAETGEIVNASRKEFDFVGVETVEAASEAEERFYTLQGVEVKNPSAGVYIRVAGGKASKVLVK